MKKTIAIFDVDGTILNTLPTIAYYVNKTLEKNGYTVIPEVDYNPLLGQGAVYLIDKALEISTGEKQDEDTVQRILSEYNAEYIKEPLYLTKPYDGIVELLEKLKSEGYILACLSNKTHEILIKVIEQFFGKELFDVIRGQIADVPVKPHPQGIYNILNDLRIMKEQAVFVGDTEVDIETGVRARVDTIAVTWGFRKLADIEGRGARVIVSNSDDLYSEIIKDEKKLRIIQYTDPICTWCWGSEPLMRKIEQHYDVDVEFVMGGMVRDVFDMAEESTPEGISAVNRWVSNHWDEASSRHGMPSNPDRFNLFDTENRSTFSMNIAVKAAQFQGPQIGKEYLRRLREASIIEGMKTNSFYVQMKLADEVRLSMDKFIDDMESGAAEEAFKEDLEIILQHDVHGFPTVEYEYGGEVIPIRGFAHFQTIEALIKGLTGNQVAKKPLDKSYDNILKFVQEYSRSYEHELKYVFELEDDEYRDFKKKAIEKEDLVEECIGRVKFLKEPNAKCRKCMRKKHEQ